MPPEPINLLSESSIRAFRREYFVRLFVVAVVLFVILTVIHAVLLFPTHFLLSSQVASRQAELNALTDSGSSGDESIFAKKIAELSKSATRIEALGVTAKVISILTDTLEIPYPGIMLSGLSYVTASGTKKQPTISLTGVAATRDNLRIYQLALASSPFTATADLPVSTYAKDTQIPFTITLTLTLP